MDFLLPIDLKIIELFVQTNVDSKQIGKLKHQSYGN